MKALDEILRSLAELQSEMKELAESYRNEQEKASDAMFKALSENKEDKYKEELANTGRSCRLANQMESSSRSLGYMIEAIEFAKKN